MRVHGLSAHGEGCIAAARDERGARVEKDWPAGSFASLCRSRVVRCGNSTIVRRDGREIFPIGCACVAFYNGAGVTYQNDAVAISLSV